MAAGNLDAAGGAHISGMGEQQLCGQHTAYEPGHWFNSAKFFDIEYQTYGWVFAQPLPNEAQFYWEHVDGTKSLRISYHKESREFFGIVSLGIRLRQEFFNFILDEHHSVDTVMKNLKQANFDPEFYDRYETSIVAAFNRNHQQQPAQV